MRKALTLACIALALATTAALAGCSDADIASSNLSEAADNFEVERRVVFFNGITDAYLLVIEGRCSIYDDGNQLEVTIKTGPDEYKKHFLGLSDNVTYFVEQLEPAKADVYHYRVIFKPEAIVPDMEMDTSRSDSPAGEWESVETTPAGE